MTKLKRTVHKPEGFTEKQMEGFSLLSHKASAIAITNRLTGSQFRLWHYLMMIDPFADQTNSGERVYHDIPSPAEIGFAIGSNPRTVEKDMDRLEKLGLYAKRITGWQGYNLTAEDGRRASEAMKLAKAERATQLLVKQPEQKPVYDKKSPEPLQDKGGYLAGAETLTVQGQGLKPLLDLGGYLAGAETLTGLGQGLKPLLDLGGYLAENPVISPQSRLNSRSSGEIAETKMAETHTGQEVQAPVEVPQTIQTIQNNSDFSLPLPLSQEKEKENEQKCLGEEEQSGGSPNIPALLKDKQKIQIQTEDPSKDHSSAALTSPEHDEAIKTEWEIAPGQPYPAFVKWRSQHYVDQGGHWAKAAIANARSEIRNNPQRAADLWQQFLEYSDRAADSALARKEVGMVPSLPPCFQDAPSPTKEDVKRSQKSEVRSQK